MSKLLYTCNVLAAIWLAGSLACQPAAAPPVVSPPAGLGFQITIAQGLQDTLLDGRMLILLGQDSTREPRYAIEDGPNTCQVYGADVEGWQVGQPAVLGPADGYPLRTWAELPAGEYYVQVVFHRYETFHLASGKTVKLPMDRGEGQQWNEAPGNLYTRPAKITLDPGKAQLVQLTLDQQIPPIEPPADTRYIKHIRILSQRLTAFWGRPMYLGANILLPEGHDTHPNARYPLAIFHGHFNHDFPGFRTEPPDPNLKPVRSERFKLDGYNRIEQELAYQLYKDWTSPGFPRVIVVDIQHANPYYDDSYAVNSANLGPYGDAITYELIPYIEQQFRGIGQGWARFLYGGSTGGWEALAAQVFYPDEYNTCYAACPDPIDFRAYCLVNLYEDKNAYQLSGAFQAVDRPGHRDYLGQVNATLRGMNYRELALGTRSRSGQQWDIWEAVYSPQGPDGYPVRIWDKVTGVIDPQVAAYWRENYDLSWIMKRDWKTLGPKLRGKIHLYCGDMDNYYLNNAVYLAEEFLESTTDPYYDGEVDYGDRAEHCWNGDHTRPNAYSRMRYHQMFIPKWTDWIQTHAPTGADLKSWRY
ncbi:MAG: alpha/beta hydrolase-fold protein [Bacteroidia bacterium]|nr:alpha/beta hydrolase-fold protein [Bacteroidia bacterium]